MERAANRATFAGRRGAIAIANAAVAYDRFRQSLHLPRGSSRPGAFPRATALGLHQHRDPRLADVMRRGPHRSRTVNPATDLAAFREHGSLPAPR
jgi:hypothetical protein